MHSTTFSKVPADGLFEGLKMRRKKGVTPPTSRLIASLQNHKFYWHDKRVYKAKPGETIAPDLKSEWVGTWVAKKREQVTLNDTIITQEIHEFKWRKDHITQENMEAVFNHNVGTETSIDGDLIHIFHEQQTEAPYIMTRNTTYLRFL